MDFNLLQDVMTVVRNQIGQGAFKNLEDTSDDEDIFDDEDTSDDCKSFVI